MRVSVSSVGHIVALVAVLSLLGCGPGEPPSPAPTDGGGGGNACADDDDDDVCDEEDLCAGFDDELDHDADGVPDGCDLCGGDDASGDSDDDGACDGLDLCEGADDGLDADGDGVPNGCDTCGGDDTSGDSDDDGVCDDLDLCEGADDSLDADGDGVPDGCDVCRGDDASGDRDGDDTCNNLDLCNGFDDSLDADGDGVPNGCDMCGGDDTSGDADDDGTCDVLDACEGFDDDVDADGDGVADGCDACSGDDASGDDDEDGVCDDLDRCDGFDDGLDADDDGTCDGLDLCDGFDDNADADGDGVPDGCDLCQGDDAGGDTDGDGDCDDIDACNVPTCLPEDMPRLMILLDASSAMLNTPDGTGPAAQGESLWDVARGAIERLHQVPVSTGRLSASAHVGLAVFGHNTPAPGEHDILVQYGTCTEDNMSWALDPESSCATPGCTDPWAGAPITWTFTEGPFDDHTVSHMPRCDGDSGAACSGSGTYTHLGLQLLNNNQVSYHQAGQLAVPAYTAGDTAYTNVLITGGRYSAYSTGAQVQNALEMMFNVGITTHVIGVGPTVQTPEGQAELGNMADWGSGGALNPVTASNEDQLFAALSAIVESMSFSTCCECN